MTRFVTEDSISIGPICIVHHLQKTMWSCFLFLVYFNFSVGHTTTPSHDKFIRDDSRKTGPIGIVHHLQKTMSGGIMLMELSFREQYFCVKLYVCEHSRLGTPVNQHVCIFTEQVFILCEMWFSWTITLWKSILTYIKASQWSSTSFVFKIVQSECSIYWIWCSDWMFFKYEYKNCTQKFDDDEAR